MYLRILASPSAERGLGGEAGGGFFRSLLREDGRLLRIFQPDCGPGREEKTRQ